MEKIILTKKEIYKDMKKEFRKRFFLFFVFFLLGLVVGYPLVYYSLHLDGNETVFAVFLLFAFIVYSGEIFFFLKFAHSFFAYFQFEYQLVEDHLVIKQDKELLSGTDAYVVKTKDKMDYSFEGLSTKLNDFSCYLSPEEKKKDLKTGDTYYILYTTQVKDSVSVGPFYYSADEYTLDDEVRKHLISFDKLKRSKPYKKTLSSNLLFASKSKHPDEEAPIDGLPLFEEDLAMNQNYDGLVLIVFAVFLLSFFFPLIFISPAALSCLLVVSVPFVLVYFRRKEKYNRKSYVVVEDKIISIPSEDNPNVRYWTYEKFYEKFHIPRYVDTSIVSDDLVPGDSCFLIFYSDTEAPLLYKKNEYDFSTSILDHLGTYDDALDMEVMIKKFYR